MPRLSQDAKRYGDLSIDHAGGRYVLADELAELSLHQARILSQAWVEDTGRPPADTASVYQEEEFSRDSETQESVFSTNVGKAGWRRTACWSFRVPPSTPMLPTIREGQFKLAVPEYDESPSRNLVHLWP